MFANAFPAYSSGGEISPELFPVTVTFLRAWLSVVDLHQIKLHLFADAFPADSSGGEIPPELFPRKVTSRRAWLSVVDLLQITWVC